MFIVIEGDNGSGKTTIGKLLEADGFYSITDDPEIKKLEKLSKEFPRSSKDRVESFLEYNMTCGAETNKYKNSLLVRYWVSTLAAAYSDSVFTEEETLNRAEKIIKQIAEPDYFIYLQCDYSERINRIERRNQLEGNLDDDTSEKRNIRYQKIIKSLSKIIPNFKIIPVTNKTPEQIKSQIDSIIWGNRDES